MRMIRSVTFGGPSRRIDLGARVARLRSAMERGNAERAKLYASTRWRKERRAFLKLNPHCVSPGCMERATVLDHRDGHQREDWAARFWDRRTWQPMCAYCHAKKSGAELGQWKDKGGGI